MDTIFSLRHIFKTNITQGIVLFTQALRATNIEHAFYINYTGMFRIL